MGRNEGYILREYKDYCMQHSMKDKFFKMAQKEDENLEDLVERFVYNIKKTKMENLDEETLKALLLKSIIDEWIDLFNVMGKGDISQLQFREICELCIHILRGKTRTGKSPRDPLLSRINKFVARTISREKLGNFLDNFKTDFLGSLSEQIDTLKIQKKQKAENAALSIFVLDVERNML